MPTSGKKFGDTLTALICSNSPVEVSVTETGSKTARPAKLLLWLRQCSTFQ
jgi:hypothetical protein